MNESSSIERRCSFNMAQANPVAESTHLYGSSFSWGSSTTLKHRSNSSMCLNNAYTSDYNSKLIASPKSKNVTKIDPRIAADVQSKGLASRIVKYHENGTRMNRSMSAHNLYSKPGQFPSVTLKKTELPYRATKQELSMIRIPPPEKSSFYGNTISSLLRSNSVIGLQSKRNEDLSRENRPIIHPPPTDKDMAPTRSVLDVLKEISRKRINSDDLELEETSKKYCNRAGNDFVDIGNNETSAMPSNVIPSSLSCQRYKRQRECITPHKSVQLSESKTSPEQAKKRVCNYNNDITSSLSSSIKSKRASAVHYLNQTMPTNLESYEMHKAKAQRYHDQHKNNRQVDKRFENLESTLSKVDAINPITPISATPCAQEESNGVGIAPKRTLSEPFYKSDEKITTNSRQEADKPRLTLFNKKCDDNEKAKASESDKSFAENTDDLGDCARIPFVKPKKITSKNGLRNPIIERTQKSKLALMLSGLRGELFQNTEDTDELDAATKKSDIYNNVNLLNSNTNALLTAVKSTSTITTLTTATSSSNVGTPNKLTHINFPNDDKTSAQASQNTSENKTSSPLVGIKLAQPISSSENLTNNLIVAATKSVETSTKPIVPVLGGFLLNNSTTSSLLGTNTSPSSNNDKGSKTTNTSTLSLSTTSSNINNFGLSRPMISNSSNGGNALQTIVKPITEENILKFPACTSFSTLSYNTNTSANSASSLSISKPFTFETNVGTPISITTTCASNMSITESIETPKNAFTFTSSSLPSPITTSYSIPIMFGTATSATHLTNTNNPHIATSITNAATFDAVSTSAKCNSLTKTPSFAFNKTEQLPTSEATKLSASVCVPVFSTGGNITPASAPKFEINPLTNTLSSNSDSSFGFDTKNKSVSNQASNNAFNSNIFGSESFKEKQLGISPTVFGNAANSTENNIFGSQSATSSFGSSSLKPIMQNFGTSIENKLTQLPTGPIFGSNNAISNTPTSFNFAIKPANTNNSISASGGFSFGSLASSKSESESIQLSNKSDGCSSTANNIFGCTASGIQNKNFTFAVNKQQVGNIASPGGFSFGSAVPPKTTTFSFGAGSISSEGTGITSNITTGFSFGGSAASKPIEISTNKPFSFGSSQPMQQQQQISSAPNSTANSSNIFSLSGAAKPVPSATFNFNAGSLNVQTNTPSTNNIFAPPPSTISTGPGDRPIRRATRRLQK